MESLTTEKIMSFIMAKKKTKEYIEFVELKTSLKTRQFVIRNLTHDESIGRISFNVGWRRYCFFPYSETVWSSDCLMKVIQKIDALNQDRKEVSQ
jgi:hypothetical protein